MLDQRVQSLKSGATQTHVIGIDQRNWVSTRSMLVRTYLEEPHGIFKGLTILTSPKNIIIQVLL